MASDVRWPTRTFLDSGHVASRVVSKGVCVPERINHDLQAVREVGDELVGVVVRIDSGSQPARGVIKRNWRTRSVWTFYVAVRAG
jgi:hypothetical protein